MSKLKSLWSDFDDRDCDKVWYRFLVWIYLKKKKRTMQLFIRQIFRCTCALYCLCMCTNVYEEISY